MSIRKISRKKGTAYRVKVMRNGKLISKSFRNKRDALMYENEVFTNEELVNTKDAQEEYLSHARQSQNKPDPASPS